VISAARKVSANILITSHATVGGSRGGLTRTCAPIAAPPIRHPGAAISIADDSIAGFKLSPLHTGAAGLRRVRPHLTYQKADNRVKTPPFDAA
jgi:hypothetical protein